MRKFTSFKKTLRILWRHWSREELNNKWGRLMYEVLSRTGWGQRMEVWKIVDHLRSWPCLTVDWEISTHQIWSALSSHQLMYTFTYIFLLKCRMPFFLPKTSLNLSPSCLLRSSAPLVILSLSCATNLSGTGLCPLAYKYVLIFATAPTSPSSCQSIPVPLSMTKICMRIIFTPYLHFTSSSPINISSLNTLDSALIFPWNYSCQDYQESAWC